MTFSHGTSEKHNFQVEQGSIGRLCVDRNEWRNLLKECGDVTSLIEQVVVKLKDGTEEVVWSADDIKSLTPVQRLVLFHCSNFLH